MKAVTASAASRPLRMAGPIPSPDMSRASPAASPIRQKRGAGQAPGRLPPDHIGVALERLEREPVGQPARRAQAGHQRVAPARQAAVATRVQPTPILRKSCFGKYQP